MIYKGDRQKVDTKGASVVSIDDTQGFRFAVCSALGSAQKVQAFSPYGLCSNPPDESLAIVFNIQGIAANKVALIDDPKNRKKGLSKGEVALANYITEAFVYLEEDGSIDIEAAPGKELKLNGATDYAVAYTDLKIAFDQLVEDFNTFVGVYNGHTQTVSGSTAQAPTSQASETTADMADAQVLTVRLP